MSETSDSPIDDIAEKMANGNGVPERRSEQIDVGLTYIGQLISHDIVAPSVPHQSDRNVSTTLNLDSIYGGNGRSMPYLDASGRFQLTRLQEGTHCGLDFFRNPLGDLDIAEIGDSRNDENIIIAQLTCFWMNFHNLLLNKKIAVDADEARRLTVQAFQLVAIEDFLSSVLHAKVFKHYFRKNKRLYRYPFSDQIPHFFSKASYRFGHSMIRVNYSLRKGRSTRLCELLRQSKEITSADVIDWSRFFGGADKAMQINTRITKIMRDIPLKTPRNVAVDVVKANLQAGDDVNLCSGPSLINKIVNQNPALDLSNLVDLHVLREEQIKNCKIGSVLSGDPEELPLWVYLLIEAEQYNGENLGPLGSILNAQVLTLSIQNSKYTVYQDGEYRYRNALNNMAKLGALIKAIAPTEEDFSMQTIINISKQMEEPCQP